MINYSLPSIMQQRPLLPWRKRARLQQMISMRTSGLFDVPHVSAGVGFLHFASGLCTEHVSKKILLRAVSPPATTQTDSAF